MISEGNKLTGCMYGMWNKYKNIVGYGVGQYYETVKDELFQSVPMTYLCDRKWDEEQVKEYDGIPVISVNKLKELENALVIILIGSRRIYEAVMKELKGQGMTVIHVDEVLGRERKIGGSVLKSKYLVGGYEDTRGNKIIFDETLPDNINIIVGGNNNRLTIGRNLVIGNLQIWLGDNSICRIGRDTEIVGAIFYVSNAKLLIGDNCLFSTEVIARTHDGHHIFDLETHKRINYAKDVIVEDNVWIGQRGYLLAGTRIGRGSVVGANAVTSGEFGEHQVIAGNPARCIRENICWSKDDTDYFNRDYLEECKA